MERYYSDKDVVKIISLTQAVTKGKTLQTSNGNGGWVDVKDLIVNDLLLYFNRYRIKSEEVDNPRDCKDSDKYEKEQIRPFKNCDELVKCWEKKMFIPAVMFTEDTRNRLYRPCIWVKNKNDNTERLIVTFGEDFVKVGSKTKPISLYVLFSDYEFLDGTPCGITE